MLLFSQSIWAIAPSEFNSALMEDVNEDIKQERYLNPKNEIGKPTRGPASVDGAKEFETKEYLKKNKVNGLHEKW